MRNFNPGIFEELNSISAAKQVCREYPKDWDKMPTITYRIENNGMVAASNQVEKRTELRFQIDIWADTSKEVSAIATAVDEIFSRQGFARVGYFDVSDPLWEHSAIKYAGIIELATNLVYQ